MLRPAFAILDETDSGLDIDAVRIVSEGVNRVASRHQTGVLVITHYERILTYIKPQFVHILFGGRIVPAGWVAEMVRPRSDVPEESMRYGLGCWLHHSGPAVILTGYDAGVSFRSVHDPETGTTHTVTSNSSGGTWPVTALLDDLQDRGMLDDTLVAALGEFGRTPRVSTLPGSTEPGRDHWARVYSGLFAGGGVQGGRVIGSSDRIGAAPTTTSSAPQQWCTAPARAPPRASAAAWHPAAR